VWNSFARETLGEQRVPQQLMSRHEIKVQFQCVFERRDRRSVIAILHVSLAKADEAIRERRIEFGNFLILSDGHVELSLLVSRDPGLHVLGGLRRCELPGAPQN
jgi:hypothetical protein